jgi:UDP-2-acetamido-2,6-beta-L-arabino-hexul-4-ose reductase
MIMEDKRKIVVIGSDGFIGKHLINYLRLKNQFDVVGVNREVFEDDLRFNDALKNANTIVHLAAINRHEDQEFLASENVRLTKRLTSACEKLNIHPHIIFSSSTQESLNNIYGQAKRNARHHIAEWSEKNKASQSGLIIPNVFGPFGRPNYNSFVATFCHKIANGETPSIIEDREVELVYVLELLDDIYKEIINPQFGEINIPTRYKIKVSDCLGKLLDFRDQYLINNEFPSLVHSFDLALFNTFRCYIPHTHYPVDYKINTDQRGSFVEIARTHTSGQTSYSTTHPGITRGNHFHTRKAERFAVISGKAKIELRKVDSDEVISYIIDGDKQPAFVDMPIWHTHNISNIGNTTLLTMFWINEPYNQEDPDTYFVNV